ncbi:MAG: helix-turn-helix transcriptional regulator [Bacteroidales bacterium]|nr:helix-turn-helix transcriptional regulator [Bacteroidales bacterium]
MANSIDILRENQVDTGFRKKWQVAIENRKWIRYSQFIALSVSDRMCELQMTQKALAEKMGCSQQYVSTLLKGNENLTLETIAKLETSLDFDLIGEALSFVSRMGLKDRSAHYLSEPESPAYGNFNAPDGPEERP